MLIGFAGNAGSGKTTFSNQAVSEYRGIKISFADPLKEIVSAITRCATKSLSSPSIKESELSPELQKVLPCKTYRELLQYIGTDLFRNKVNKDFWLAANERRITSLMLIYNLVVIDDVRFQNEVDYIHDKGGKVILLKTDREDGAHESEKTNTLKGIDHTVVNTLNNKNAIWKQIDKCLRTIL